MVTLGELKAGALEARWGEARRDQLADYLRGYAVLPIDVDVADVYALLRSRCRHLGRRQSPHDLWIAATARRYSIPVATLDQDFESIPGLTVIREDGSEIVVPD